VDAFFVYERRRNRRVPSAIRSERSAQLNTAAFAEKVFKAALGTMETLNLYLGWAGLTRWPRRRQLPPSWPSVRKPSCATPLSGLKCRPSSSEDRGRPPYAHARATG
jgi:hypothetical protein